MKFKEFCKKNIPLSSAILIILALVCVIIKTVSVLSVPFAEFFNRYISAFFRMISAFVSGILPFSIAETSVICAIPFAILFVVYSIKVSAKNDTLLRQLFRLVGVICFIFSTFVLNYSTGYDTAPLSDKMGIEAKTPDVEELQLASTLAGIQIYRCEDGFDYKSGATKMPFTFSELCDKLNDAYNTLADEYDFISHLRAPVKQIALSKPLTYTHMSGFYTFFTGEANVNMNYPDYIIVFTTAHEMAHQRGIAREDEANFVAFLACTAAENKYINYCGYANILEYLAVAFASADEDRYYSELVKFLPESFKHDIVAFSEMFKPYKDNIAADVTSSANNAYLKSQRVEEGEKSYSLVVDLATAYIIEKFAQ